jgi:hypothetical protein
MYQHLLELPVLLGQSVLVLGGSAVHLFQTEDLFLQGFDVILFPLTMSALCLPIKLLSPCQGRLAIWLGASALGRRTVRLTELVGVARGSCGQNARSSFTHCESRACPTGISAH